MNFPNKGDIPKTQKVLYKLVGDTYDKMKFIHENYSEENLEEIKNAHQEIYGTLNSNGEYEGGKLKELEQAYNDILEDDEDNEKIGLKSQIESLLEELQNEKTSKIDDFITKVNGTFEEDANGERKSNNDGMFHKINAQINSFDKLYKEIDKKLEAGTTSLELATVFSNKVKKYSRAGIWWNIVFIALIVVLGYFIFDSIENITLEYKDVYLHLLLNLPFLIFAIWGLIFVGNRRAEAKKLEESYKHKEVMARAYVGYKESIAELDNTDNELLETHMSNLLEAMKVDSSEFLSSKGENHPFLDLLHNFSKKDVKDIKSLLEDFGIDISINKK